jgi:hypothetical protein
MTIVRIGGYIVEQVPIEQIEPGDTVLTHLPNGSHYTFVVETKRVVTDGAGTSKIGLQAAHETDTHGIGLVASIAVPAGTLTNRVHPARVNPHVTKEARLEGHPFDIDHLIRLLHPATSPFPANCSLLDGPARVR